MTKEKQPVEIPQELVSDFGIISYYIIEKWNGEPEYLHEYGLNIVTLWNWEINGALVFTNLKKAEEVAAELRSLNKGSINILQVTIKDGHLRLIKV